MVILNAHEYAFAKITEERTGDMHEVGALIVITKNH